jgi:polysaccharide pyruvyl transferase CsaB
MKIVISGFYGAENTGDEAILSSIVSSIKEKYPDSEFIIFSVNASYTTKIHKLKAVFRPCFNRKFFQTDFLSIYSSIKNSDLVIIGGGGILQDVHNYLTIPCFLHTVILAKLLNKPVMFYSVGVGPIKNKISELLVRDVCNISDLITVRDNLSKEYLMRIGVNNVPIIVSADPVFALSSVSTERAKEILFCENIPIKKPMIGISIRYVEWFKMDKKQLAKLLDYLVEHYNSTVILVPFGYDGIPSDLEICEQLIKESKKDIYLIREKYHPQEIAGIIGQFDFLIGMRLHSLIMSSIMNVPVLGISYLPKVRSALIQMGYTDSLFIDEELKNISFEDFKQKIETSYENKELIKEMIREPIQKLKQKALEPSFLIESINFRKISSTRMVTVIFSYIFGLVILLNYEIFEILIKKIKIKLRAATPT